MTVMVATRELCQELYEVSEWEADHWWTDHGPELGWIDGSCEEGGDIPAYDLGYLLRKLPKGASVKRSTWGDQYHATIGSPYAYSADTPEDAAARLCAELLKAGVLHA